MTRVSASLASLLVVCATAACAVDPPDPSTAINTPTPGGPVTPVGPAMAGLHVVGNHIENADGATVVLRGVNRSGTEYQCVHNVGIFDGPGTEASVAAIAAWKGVNAIRVPLNEACWLAINGSTNSAYTGAPYKQAILAYVGILHQFHIVPILDLHWVGPGTSPADRQQPMPDADHAAAFWTDVATTFAGDDGVVYEPYNEPFPDSNRDSTAAWTCWRDGCTARQAVPSGMPAMMYQATGLQALVDAIRGTGATNLILLGGVQYSNALTQWLAYKPNDPMGNIAPALHAYNFNACTANCWDTVLSNVVASVPLVATEFGENDCMGATFETPLLSWLDAHGAGYLAWSWNAYGACQPAAAATATTAAVRGQPWSLITDYTSGNPNGGYAQTFHDHLAGL
jgi:hypothetical protein